MHIANVNQDEDVEEVLVDPRLAQDAFGAIQCIRKYFSLQTNCDGEYSIRRSKNKFIMPFF